MIVYGAILYTNCITTSTVLIGLFVFLTALEYLIRVVEKYAKLWKYDGLYSKLKQELMILGIISFTVFIFESSHSQDTDDSHGTPYFDAFEVAHIILLFVAFSFILQALFLIQYASNMSRTYLSAVKTSALQLLEDMRSMIAECAIISNNTDNTHPLSMSRFKVSSLYIFDNVPFWLPSFSTLRDNIEFRIIERFFISKHVLPDEFEYAKYIAELFHTYVSELGEVSPTSWLVLSILVCFNLIKIKSFDKTEKYDACKHGKYKITSNPHGYYETFVCEEYLLRYAYVCGVLLNISTLCIFFASCYYVKKLLMLSMKENFSDLGYGNDCRSSEYNLILKKLIKDEENHDESINPLNATNPIFNQGSDNSKLKSRKSIVAEYRDMLLSKQESQRIIHDNEPSAHVEKINVESVSHSIVSYIKSLLELSGPDEHTTELYLFQSPFLFFKFIEINLLLQSFYIAIYLTQLLPITTQSSYSGGW